MKQQNSTEAHDCDFTVMFNGEVCRVVDATPTSCTALHSEWVDHLKTELFKAPKGMKRKRWESAAAYAKRMRKKGIANG